MTRNVQEGDGWRGFLVARAKEILLVGGATLTIIGVAKEINSPDPDVAVDWSAIEVMAGIGAMALETYLNMENTGNDNTPITGDRQPVSPTDVKLTEF